MRKRAAPDIYVVHHRTRLGWGGALTFGRALTEALRATGVTTRDIVLDTSSPRTVLPADPQTIFLRATDGWWRLRRWRLSRLLSHKFSTLPPPRMGLVAMSAQVVRAARRAWPSARVVYRLPCLLTNCVPFTWPASRPPSIWARLDHALLRRAERDALCIADVVLAPTYAARVEALCLQPAADRHTLVCPHGPAPHALNPALRERQRAALGLDTRAFVALAVGYCDRNKHFSLAIRALVHADPRLQLVIVGDGPERESLGLLASQLGVRPRVLLAGPQTDMDPWYAAADCVVSTSHYDMHPNAVLEGLAHGRPVLVPHHDPPRTYAGAAEIISTSVCAGAQAVLAGAQTASRFARATGLCATLGGRTYEPTPCALAAELTRLSENPALVARLGREALAIAAARADWSPILNIILDRSPLPIAPVGPDSRTDATAQFCDAT